MLPNLKLLRKEYGISQQVLADMMGVSQQSINQYENHSIEPDIALLTQWLIILTPPLIILSAAQRFAARSSAWKPFI